MSERILEGQVGDRHRLHQRHRAGHRPRARGRRLQRDAERLRRSARDRRASLRHGDGVRRQGRRQRRRHFVASADPRDGGAGDARAGRGRHPGQQRRHPAHRCRRGIPRGQVGRDHRDQPVVELPRDQGGAAADARAQLGADRQHRIGARPRRIDREVGVRDCQARRARTHEGRRAGDRHHRGHLQRHLPRLGTDAARAEADRRPRARQGHVGRAGTHRAAVGEAAVARVRNARADGCAHRVPVLRERRADSRAWRCRSTAAGSRNNNQTRRGRSHDAEGERRARSTSITSSTARGTTSCSPSTATSDAPTGSISCCRSCQPTSA